MEEASEHWDVVAGALVDDRTSFVERFVQGKICEPAAPDRSTEPRVAHSLKMVCHHGLHGLLVQWAFEEASSRLQSFAVPRFWASYDRLLESAHVGVQSTREAAAAQRLCVTVLQSALSELRAFVEGELLLLHKLESGSWPEIGVEQANDAVSSFPAQFEAPSRVLVGLGRSLREELLSLLQTLLISAAPHAKAIEEWLSHCWHRLFVDSTSGEGIGTSGIAALLTWSGEDDEQLGEINSDEEEWRDGEGEEGEDDEPMDIGEQGQPLPSGYGLKCDTFNNIGSTAARLLQSLSRELRGLGWSAWVDASVSKTLHETFRRALRRRCARQFEQRVLGRMLGWIDRRVLPWLSLLLDPDHSFSGSTPSPPLRQWRARLRFFIMQALAEMRIGELFDIIVDFPESSPAIDDLRVCLQRTQQHADTVNGLGEALEARLLKPGADTSNIIQVYICAIRALRRLDPSGLTLEAVSDRVRAYLKMRPDTVRQVVSSLIDPQSSDLLDPSDSSDPSGIDIVQEEGDSAIDADDTRGDEAAMLEWQPDPLQSGIHAAGDSHGLSLVRRSADVLSILVNIYGSKALFVNEFRSMLADKLLASAGGDTEKEVRNLEMLKKRFGDSALAACEVMLTDVAESRRVSRAIRSHLGAAAAQSAGDDASAPIDATIVSRLSWPHLSQEIFELPLGIKKEMGRFEKQYAHLKAPRKLVWKPSLGVVTLDVKFANTVVKDVQCTPLQATILLKFGAQPKWTLSDLSRSLGVASDSLKKKMSLWLNRGFIMETPATAVAEHTYNAVISLGASDDSHTAAADEDGGDAGASMAAEQLAQENKVYEQYIMGMLTNLESLPLQRIHNMLKMFVAASGADRGYDRTESELQRFLHVLVDDGKLELSGGQYRVHRG